MTFKELEALYWVAQLGGFGPAALRLHTAQSAVSKRVQELEMFLGVPLFDRSQRASRLTEKGDEMVVLAKRMLDLREEAIVQVSDPMRISRTLRVGVTELTAMTWLPRLSGLIQDRYPMVNVEPDVDSSLALRDKLLADEIDLMIAPDAFSEARFVTEFVGSVENAWMCKPGLIDDTRPLSLSELNSYTLLANRSGPGLIYAKWFKAAGFEPTRRLSSNSVVALVSMAVSGLGVSYLPKESFRHLVAAGRLVVLDITPALPVVNYVAMHKTSRRSELTDAFVGLARECCDFSEILLAAQV